MAEKILSLIKVWIFLHALIGDQVYNPEIWNTHVCNKQTKFETRLNYHRILSYFGSSQYLLFRSNINKKAFQSTANSPLANRCMSYKWKSLNMSGGPQVNKFEKVWEVSRVNKFEQSHMWKSSLRTDWLTDKTENIASRQTTYADGNDDGSFHREPWWTNTKMLFCNWPICQCDLHRLIR